MRLKLSPKLILTALFAAAVIPVYSQVTPAARQGSLPIEIGAGFSNYSVDWGPGRRMDGITAWLDWYPTNLFPPTLNGLGFEVTGHDIDYAKPAGLERLRQDTGMVGPIFQWNHSHYFHPYVKYLIGIGSIDFPPDGKYSHDTFLVMAPAGGAEFRAWRHVWIRGDYEYQFWHDTFGPTDLTPTGFTVGASYDFRR